MNCVSCVILETMYNKTINKFVFFCEIIGNSYGRLSQSPSLLISGSGSRLQLLSCASRSRKTACRHVSKSTVKVSISFNIQ